MLYKTVALQVSEAQSIPENKLISLEIPQLLSLENPMFESTGLCFSVVDF